MTIQGIDCKIVNRLGKRAEIEVEGQKITIPSDFVPNDAGTGATLKLFFLNSGEANLEEKKMAKAILEHILNGG
jgi:hypothetical protein